MLHAIAIRPFCLLSSESGGIFSLMWELLLAKVSGLQKAHAGEKNHGFRLTHSLYVLILKRAPLDLS